MNGSFIDVRPERFVGIQNHTDEHNGRIAAYVRRGDHLPEADDQSFRFRKDLGLPNQVRLFRRLDFSRSGASRSVMRSLLLVTNANSYYHQL
jgi:hypothetical protein